jgi:hypothetical protein
MKMRGMQPLGQQWSTLERVFRSSRLKYCPGSYHIFTIPISFDESLRIVPLVSVTSTSSFASCASSHKRSNHTMEPTPPDLFITRSQCNRFPATSRALGGVAHLVLVGRQHTWS